jgi:diguanylate cyclase (GGDEF)-like protein/PAS domain S-box-containing protein
MDDDKTYCEQDACKATVGQVAILDKEGNVQLVNQGWAEGSQGNCPFVCGIREGDNFFSSLHKPHCIHEPVMEEIKQAVRDVLAHTRPEYFQEYVCQCRANVQQWMQINITPLHEKEGGIISQVNITKRKQQEEQLRESEERYKTLVNILPYLLVVHRDGKVLFINPAGIKMLKGQSEADFIGKNPLDVVAVPYRDIAQRRMQQMFEQGLSSDTIEEQFYGLDGSTIDLEVTAVPFDTKDGRTVQVVAHDITEKKAAMQKIIERETLLRSIFDTVPDCIRIMNLDGEVLMINKSGLRIMGVQDEKELQGKVLESIVIAPYKEKFKQLMENVKKGESGQLAYDVVNFKKQILHLETRMVPLRDGKDDISGVLVVTRDVTAQRDAESQALRATADLHYIENHDPVTGLPNKQLFKEILRRKLEEGRKENRKTCLILVDLDHFKDLIEVHGEKVAQEYLLAFKERLQASIKHYDEVGHFGGDKFGIVISEALSEEQFQKVMSKIFFRLSEPLSDFTPDTVEGRISMGIAFAHASQEFPTDNGSDSSQVDRMIQQAMQAIAIAKQKGGHCYEYFSPSMSDQFHERKEMEKDLRKAVEKENEFCLYYQPQYDLETGHIIGMEALVRWNHPQKGLLAPAKFIALAEETGLMVPLGEWVFKEACRQQKEWTDKGYHYRLSINLSLEQLKSSSFVEMVQKTLEETKTDPRTLELEITESMVMKEHMVDKIEQLKKLGFLISIDDFGTEYSSLSRLINFPIDRLKIDRLFIRQLLHNRPVASIIRAILSFANDNKVRVVAEGVETEEQRTYLKGLGCHEIQGYLMSVPLSPEDFETYADQQKKKK